MKHKCRRYSSGKAAPRQAADENPYALCPHRLALAGNVGRGRLHEAIARRQSTINLIGNNHAACRELTLISWHRSRRALPAMSVLIFGALY